MRSGPRIARIESRANPRFLLWKKMAFRPQEIDCPWVPVEGWKQIEELAQERPIPLLLYGSQAKSARLESLVGKSVESYELAPPLFKALSDVETPQGLLAFFEKPRWRRRDLTPLLLYLDHLQDPGNLGALLRTARAVGASLASGHGGVSRFNPKAVRASGGALFSVPFSEGITPEELVRLGYCLWVADPGPAGVDLYEAPLRTPLAVVVGGEGGGPGEKALAASQGRLSIPMKAGCQSLNAAVAGAVILYECRRRGLADTTARGAEAEFDR